MDEYYQYILDLRRCDCRERFTDYNMVDPECSGDDYPSHGWRFDVADVLEDLDGKYCRLLQMVDDYLKARDYGTVEDQHKALLSLRKEVDDGDRQ